MSMLDWTIACGAVLLMIVQGWWVSGAQKTTEDYFVGGRKMHWFAVGLSMFAATFSPLSFVGLPREAAYDNYHRCSASVRWACRMLYIIPSEGLEPSQDVWRDPRPARRVRRCAGLLQSLSFSLQIGLHVDLG